MNKLFLAVAISVCALAQAQTQAQTTSISIPNGATLSDATGACLKQGVTGVSVSGSTISLTGGSACGGPVLTPLTVNVTFPPSTYASGNPTVSWSSTPAVSCTVSESGAATLNQTGSNPVTFDVPTVAGSYNFSVNCAAPTGYTISYAPGNSSTMTVSGGGGGNPNGPCDPTQSSDSIGGKTLARQCKGTVSFRTSPTSYPAKADYSGDLVDLPTILSGNTRAGNFMGMLSGAPMLFSINSGAYVSFAFTPNVSGLVQFSPNASYGEAGVISLSTRPGQFMPGNAAVICTNATGGGLYASGAAGAMCPLVANQTYYINFAGVDYNGNQFCGGGTTGVCSSVLLAYTEYAKKF